MVGRPVHPGVVDTWSSAGEGRAGVGRQLHLHRGEDSRFLSPQVAAVKKEL